MCGIGRKKQSKRGKRGGGIWSLAASCFKEAYGGAHVERLDTYLYFFGQLKVEM